MEIGKELIEACIAQNRAATHQLYKLCFSLLMQICMRYARSKDEATEMLNTAFVKIVFHLHKYDPAQPIVPWLKKVTINTIIDKYRVEKTYRDNLLSVENPEAWEQADGQINNHIYDRIGYDHLLQLIRKLPPVTGSVFNLYAIDGFKHREIADMLGMSENTSKWHLSHARQLLQANLQEEKVKRHASGRI